MITRTSRTPSFILIGLLVVIAIISYNYWLSIKTNNDLQKEILTITGKLTELTNKKASIDKDNEAFASRIKYFEERSEQNQQAINKKDQEMNEINKKLKDAQVEIDSLKSLNNDNSNKLKNCENDRVELAQVKSDKSSVSDENARLKNQINELNNRLKLIPDCDAKINNKLLSIFEKLNQEYTDASLRKRFKELFEINDSSNQSVVDANNKPEEKQQANEVSQVSEKQIEVKRETETNVQLVKSVENKQSQIDVAPVADKDEIDIHKEGEVVNLPQPDHDAEHHESVISNTKEVDNADDIKPFGDDHKPFGNDHKPDGDDDKLNEENDQNNK